MKKKYQVGFILFLNLLAFQSWCQWVEISSGTGVTSGPQITDMAVSNSGALLAGTLKGIYRSGNSGGSWVPANTGVTDGPVNAFTINGSYIFVTMNGGDGVLRSSDDGKSWSKVNNGLPSFAVVGLQTVNGRIFAQINQGAVLYYSDDNGNAWSPMTNISLVVNSMARSGTTIFLGTSNGVYRSTDTGASWQLANSGLTNTNVIKVAASENTLVTWTSGGTFISVNNGSSWTITGLPTGYPNIAQIASTILVSYNQGLMWRSTNAGGSWAIVNQVPAAGVLKSVGSDFFASTVQGVYVSKDDGISWSPAHIGILDIYPPLSIDGSLIITTNGTTVKISQDWGAIWTSQTVGTSSDISVLAKGNVLYVSNRNSVWSSANKGLTWTTVPALGFDKILAAGESNLYAVDTHNLYRSVNNGPWVQQSSVVRWISAIAAKGNKVFTGSRFSGGTFTGVFSSVNDGVTWTQVNNTLPPVNAMAYNGTLLVCGTSSGVYKSANDGVTWTLAGLEGSNINSVIFDKGNILAAHKGIDMSTDNGVSWTSVTGEIGPSLDALHDVTALVTSGTRILAATSTGSVWISKCVDPPTPVVTGVWTHHPTTLASSSAANNQWYLNGNKIVGATSQNLEVNASGTYTVRVIVDGCTSQPSAPYIITDCIIPPTPTISVSGTNPQFTLTSSAPAGNQWFLNGTLIPDAKDQHYIPTATGNYSVRVTLDGCQGSSSSSFPLVITGDIQNQNAAIKIYPNPVNDELIINHDLPSGVEQITIKIFDLLGRVLHDEAVATGYPVRIHTSFLVSGVYCIEVSHPRSMFRSRFVKK